MHKKIIFYVAGISICVMLFLLIITNSFHNIDLIITDVYFKIRKNQPISEKIIVIEIDEYSLKKFGAWPWSREVMAYFLSALSKYHPDLVFLDVFFSEKYPIIDQFLINALDQSKNVCLPVIFPHPPSYKKKLDHKSLTNIYTDKILSLHDEIYEKAFFKGHGHTLPADDGIIRSVPLFIQYEDSFIPQFTLEAICHYLHLNMKKAYKDRQNIIIPHQNKKNSKLIIPVNSYGEFFINWAGKWNNTFERISMSELLSIHEEIKEGKKNKDTLNKQLKNKICFIGLTAVGLFDIKPTSIDKNYPMLGVHVNLVNNILTNNMLVRFSRWTQIIIIFLYALLSMLLLIKFKHYCYFLYYILFLILWIPITFLSFSKLNIVLPIAAPVIASISSLVIYLIFNYIQSAYESKKLMLQAITDELTHLYTHRYFKYKLQTIFKKAQKTKFFHALLMIDIDNFKNINDTFGHENGNIVLANVANSLMNKGHEPDMINCRYGGEEFCVILTNITKQDSIKYGEELVHEINSYTHHFTDQVLKISVSVGGIHSSDQFSKKPVDFVKASDSAMYEAKKTGKNKFVYFEPCFYFSNKSLSSKLDFKTNGNNIKSTPSMLEFVSEDLQSRNKELESIINKMQNMQDIILKYEKETATRMITAFVSHELNKPMQNIINCMGRIKSKTKHMNEVQEYVVIVSKEIVRITSLSHQMLNFHKPINQIKKLNNINDILNKIIKMTQDRFASKKINLEIDLFSDLRKTYCSEDELTQVFLNIIFNAVDAIHHDGIILIKTIQDENNIIITIKDNGKGMTKEVQEKIFQPFFSTKVKKGGTGLGLAISLKIIKRHNGVLTLNSEKDKGTTFVITLPIIDLK